MNTMTFTIESVHGVKQTLVLGLSTPTSAADAGKDQGWRCAWSAGRTLARIADALRPNSSVCRSVHEEKGRLSDVAARVLAD